jgi:group I intron endonuclease
MLVYKIVRILPDGSDGKIYIGQTIHSLRVRQSAYKKDIQKLRNQKISPRPIISAMLKYGFDNFRWEILEENLPDYQTLDQREIDWIALLQSTDKKIGYNISPGGDLSTRGRKLEGEALEKARAMALLGSQIAADLMRGKPLTGIRLETTLENVKKAGQKSAEVRKGRSLPEKHRNNISVGLTNNPKVISASQKPRPKRRVSLTQDQIENIRQDARPYKQIALDYDISVATISRIKNHQRYFTG